MKDQGQTRVTRDGIHIFADADFDGMRASGNLAAKTLDMITEHVVPGVTTERARRCPQYLFENNVLGERTRG